MFPQHIKKGFFSWIAFSILWFSISFIQLIILSIWAVFSLWTFTSFNNSGARWIGIVLSVLIWLIFIVIAFFRISELNLLAFIAKKIKDYFLDVPKKFQVNYAKIDPVEITIAKAKQEKWKQRIEIKEWFDSSEVTEIEKKWIL